LPARWFFASVDRTPAKQDHIERIPPVGKTERIEQLFQSIDTRNTDAFLTFLTDDVMFRFGNAEPVKGKEEVGNAVQGFFESIQALSHDLHEILEHPDAVVCHGMVTYTRHDSSTLTVPFANIFGMSGDSIRDYLIFIDVSQLYNPA
jgi:ketosteroid isomerase-like protein